MALSNSTLMTINYYLEIHNSKPGTFGGTGGKKPRFDVYEFVGEEHVNDDFQYNISIVSLKHINIKDFLNLEAELHLSVNKESRSIKGYISGVKALAKIGVYFIYELKLTSWLEYLKYAKYSRIYQDLTTEEIIQKTVSEVNGTLGMSFKINFSLSISKNKHYLKREYCVQYNESVYDFIFRLIEEEGMFIQIDKNIVTVTDHNPTGQGIINATVNEEISIFSSNISYNSYNYEHVNHNFQANQKGMTYDHEEGRYLVDQKGVHNTLPTDVFLDRLDVEEKDNTITDYIQQKAEIDANRHMVSAKSMKGNSKNLHSNAGLTCIILDKTNGLHAFKQKSMIISSKSMGKKPNTLHEYAPDNAKGVFTSDFIFIDDTIFYRPPLKRHKNKIHSKQIAIIGGLSTEEKYIDSMGRVKVQFFWNNKLTDKEDENSLSCWVRLSHIWNGNQNGAMFIPSVGQEVLVTFVNGDPDYPIVDGMLYNAKNQAKNDWQSTINQWSITTKSSGKETSNDKFSQIMFDSTNGKEKIYLKSEKDLTSLIKNDEDRTVSKNQTITIGEDQITEVKNNQVTTIGGSQNVSINKNYSLDVEHKFEHKSENSVEQVTKNKMILVAENLKTEVLKDNSLTVTGENTNYFQNLYTSTFQLHSLDYYESSKSTYIANDNHMKIMGSSIKELDKNLFVKTNGTFKIKSEDNIQIESSSGISLNAGGNFITITKDDISISGKKIQINSGGSILKVKDSEAKDIDKTTHGSIRVASLKITDGQYKHGRSRLKCEIKVERWKNKDEGWKATTSLTEAEKAMIKYEALYMNTEGKAPEMLATFTSQDGFKFEVPPIKDKIYKHLKLFAYVRNKKEATASLELNRDLRIRDLTKSTGNQYTATTNLADLRKASEKTIPMREELFILWQKTTDSTAVISTIIEKPPVGNPPESHGSVWNYKATEPTKIIVYERKYGSYVTLAFDGTKESKAKRPRRSTKQEPKKKKFGWSADLSEEGVALGLSVGDMSLGLSKKGLTIGKGDFKFTIPIDKITLATRLLHHSKAVEHITKEIHKGSDKRKNQLMEALHITTPDEVNQEKIKNSIKAQIEKFLKEGKFICKPSKDGSSLILQASGHIGSDGAKTWMVKATEKLKK